jgi:hypothetical protein
MYGIDTHLPLGKNVLTNMKYIYLNFSEISTVCVVCKNLSVQVNVLWQNALVYCMDEGEFEYAVKINEHGLDNVVKICKGL